MVLAQKKIIWCDRFIDDQEIYIERILKEIPYIEIVKSSNSLEAAQILQDDKNFALIISAQFFLTMTGIEFYHKIDRDYSSKMPFILFTAALNAKEIESCSLRNNFYYLSKFHSNPSSHHVYEGYDTILERLIYMIDDMIFRNDENLSAVHLKLQELRTALGLTLEQFSQLVGFDVKNVTSFETSSENIPSSYIHHLSAKFNIPPTLFICGPVAVFIVKIHRVICKADFGSRKKLIIS